MLGNGPLAWDEQRYLWKLYYCERPLHQAVPTPAPESSKNPGGLEARKSLAP